jgi:hypothetical protein
VFLYNGASRGGAGVEAQVYVAGDDFVFVADDELLAACGVGNFTGVALHGTVVFAQEVDCEQCFVFV